HCHYIPSFSFNPTPTTDIYTLSLHDALPICRIAGSMRGSAARPLKERAMALKIYGIPRSRAFRTLWMAKELGLEYENIPIDTQRSEEHTSELQSRGHLVCRLLLEKKKKKDNL